MKASGLQLSRNFFPEMKVEASPKGDEMDLLPDLKAFALVESAENLHVSVKMTWGSVEKNIYAVSIRAFGVFLIPKHAPPDTPETFLARNLKDLVRNAVQIIYGSVRELVSTLTSRGPHGTRYLPAIIFDDRDITIFSGDETREILAASKPAKKKTRSKRKTKSPE